MSFWPRGTSVPRCHDHKFDPILQKDYYRMKAFFAAFQPAEAHPIADVATRAVAAGKDESVGRGDVGDPRAFA